ncbi:MAG: hypothetical protein ACMUJM_20640 [bacterium]
MKKIEFITFLILLCISFFLLAGTLTAESFSEISPVSTNSIDLLYTSWNNWPLASSAADARQVNEMVTTFNVEINESIWSAATTESFSSGWDWAVTAPSWSISQLNVMMSKSSLEIDRNIWLYTPTFSISSLWDWSDTPPAWSPGLSNQILTNKPLDFDTIYGKTHTSVEYDFDQLWERIGEAFEQHKHWPFQVDGKIENSDIEEILIILNREKEKRHEILKFKILQDGSIAVTVGEIRSPFDADGYKYIFIKTNGNWELSRKNWWIS